MTTRNLGSLALLLALVGLSFGLVGCGDNQTTTSDTSDTTDVFIADADNPEDFARLAKELDIPVEELGELEVHRGSKKADLADIYWPQKNVTIEGLQSYRIDVDDEYDGNGTLEFRKGNTVLHSEPFDPENSVTVGAIPQSVLDALKRGNTVKWGIFFEGRDKRKSVSASFKVVSGDSVSKRIKKLEGSKHFLRQTPQTREMLKTEVILNKRLYSEALVQYLGILNAWPESTSPYRGIVKACRRLDLEDTELFVLASDNVRGGGKLGRRTENAKIRGNAGGIGNSVDVGDLPKSIETTAPPLQQRTSDGPKPFGKTGVTPDAQDYTKKPDETDGTEEPGVMVDDLAEQARLREAAGIRYNELNDQASRMETQAGEYSAKVESLKEAQNEFNHYKGKLESATALAATTQLNLESKQNSYDTAKDAWETAGSPDPSPLKDAMDNAQVERDLAQAEAQQAEQGRQEAQDGFDRSSAELGQAASELGIGFDPSAPEAVDPLEIEEVEQRADQMNQMAADAREQAEAFKKQIMMDLATPDERTELEEANRIAEHQAQVNEARSNFYDAEQEGVQALNTLNDATAAHGQAMQEVEDAEQDYADTPNATTQLALENAQQALLQAESDLQNAQNEVLNAEEKINRASSELEALGIDPRDPGLGPQNPPGDGLDDR